MILPEKIIVNGISFAAEDLAAVAALGWPFEVHMRDGVLASKGLLDKKLAEGYAIYGVNTGYGKDVSSVFWGRDRMIESQKNCVRSLLCGASTSGESLPMPIIKGAMLARINCLSMGYSAVRPCVIEKLAEAVQMNLIPHVPPFGSVGASGDLIPSSYIANFIFGNFAENPRLLCHTPKGSMPLGEAYRTFGFRPLADIEPKECLSIINSVSFCASIASLVIFELKKIADCIAIAMAFSSQAVRCFSEDFLPYVQELRSGRESGAVKFARKVWELNSPSPLLLDAEAYRTGAKKGVPLQDAYSLGRCASQQMDSYYDIMEIVEKKLNTILNRVHDNPIVDPYTQRIYHSGNFYAGDIASRMDWTRVEIGKAAKLLHAVINRLLDEHKNNGLPANLVWRQSGIENGLKGVNLLETSLTTMLSGVVAISPLAVSTERDNQDIVSLGMDAAMETYQRIFDRFQSLAASTLICALQAFDLRLEKEGLQLSEALFNPKLVQLHQIFRSIVPFMKEDMSFHNPIEDLKMFIRDKGHTITNDQL